MERADQLYRAPFQSTPSVWRETKIMAEAETAPAISIHSLRVEGDDTAHPILLRGAISIHSLRVEGDSTAFPMPHL